MYYKKALDSIDTDKKIEILEKNISNLSSDKLDKLIEIISEYVNE